MPTTGSDYPSQLKRMPVIDPRAYNVQADGVTDDSAAMQAAMDAAGSGAFNSMPCVVEVPRGKVLLRTVLKFRNDGIILQGWGMMGEGFTLDNVPSCFVADNAHDATSMIQIDPNDRIGGAFQWYRGVAIRDLSIDVSASSAFTSASTPPSVLKIRGLSNCPEFQNITIYGFTGTAIDIATNPVTTAAISENLRFENCWLYGGYNASGGSLGIYPKAPGIVVSGADNIQFHGGLVGYFFAGINNPSPVVPTVNNNLTDIPAIQIIPGVAGTGANVINNGCIFREMAITNYVVSVRLSSLNVSGTWYGPQFCRFEDMIIENFNKAFQINQENTASSYGFWRSRGLIIRGCELGGSLAFYGTNPHSVQASNVQGGDIALETLFFNGDVITDQYCSGIRGTFGPNPSGGFASVTDAGTNIWDYAMYGAPGRIITKVLKLPFDQDPAVAFNPVTAGARCPLQMWGDTVKMFDWPSPYTGRPIANSAATGTMGEFCAGFTGGSWYLYLCVQSNTWVRFGPATYPF